MPVKIVRKRVSKKPGESGWYSEKQRIDAVCKYMVCGNLRAVMEQTGILETTLRKWKSSPWWKEVEEEVRKQAQTELKGKLGKVVHKAIDAVEDRLDNGDWNYDRKTGKVSRIPVRSRDASQIAKDMFDRQLVLDNIVSRDKLNEVTIEDRLKAIQEEMKKFARGHVIVREVLDVPFTDSSVEDMGTQLMVEAKAQDGSEG